MNCPNCQTVNPESAKFCSNCGTALARPCSNCGTPNPAGAKFCNNCGAALSPPPSTLPPPLRLMPSEFAAKLEAARASRTMEGERRIVTILFCDVKGSTALAEQLDPEEWTEIMNSAFEFLIKPVYRFEGTVARLMGDAILAFFGAPIAHEDDAQRAVLAGLGIVEGIQDYREKMKQERGLDFNVRVGINTGLVVVGAVGSDLRVEYTAMGDAVNIAARMEQTARPGSVQIAGATHKLLAPLFDFEALGEIEVKGKTEPVAVYRVLGPKAAPGRLRGIEGLESPLVGRENEMAALRQAVNSLLEGRGQIVSVMGEAGLGKSRLVAELRQSLISNHQLPTTFFEGRSLSYQTTIPYAPFVDLFGRIFGLAPDDTPEEKYAKVRARCADLLPGRVAETAPFLGTLLGASLPAEHAERVKYLEPPQMRERTFGAARGVIERLAGMSPTVLVFEDLHWADSTSLDLLTQLLPLTEREMLMILGLFRPQRQEQSWRFHEAAARDFAHRYTAITLEPLDESRSRELVANLLRIEDLPEKVRGLILKKAEGNPFFVEEVIRSLLDARLVVRDDSHWRATREIENIAVPDTLAGVITARLDRLDDESKHTAQTASVIGREFQRDTLAEVSEARPALDAALQTLEQRELIRAKTARPHAAYLFKHALTQETAYASLLLSRRRELHRRVAECLERTQPDRVNDIARHFLEAQETARALPYLVEAGDRAAQAYSMPEAIGYYQRALEIIRTTVHLPLARRAYEGLGRARKLTGDMPGAMETFQRMAQYAADNGDVPMRVSALNKVSEAGMWLGQFAEVEIHLTEAERLAREYNDRLGLAELYTVRCGVCMFTADFGGAVKYLGESVEVGRELNAKEQMAFGLAHIANTWTFIADFDRAWEAAQECLRISDEIGQLDHRAEVTAVPIPLYHLRNGDFDAARKTAEESLTLSVRIGLAMGESDSSYTLGLIAHMRGEYEQAMAHLTRARQAGEKAGNPIQAAIPCAIGAIYLEISQALASEAEAQFQQAAPMLASPIGAAVGGAAWADLAFAELRLGNLPAAEALLNKGLTVPTMMTMLNRPRLLTEMADLMLARGRLDEAQQHSDEARAFTEARRMKHFYPSVRLAEARLSRARGEFDRALDQFGSAESLAVEMGMRPAVWQARAGAAQALEGLGRQDEAETKRRAARAVVDEIAGLFEDEKLRAAFVENAARSIGS